MVRASTTEAVLAREEMSSVPRAWLSDEVSRELFDTLVAARAEPGTVRSLPATIRRPHVSTLGWLALGLAGVDVPANLGEADLPNVVWLAVAFGDVDVPVSVGDDPDGRLARFLREATGSPIVALDEARLVILPEPSDHQLSQLRAGDEGRPGTACRVAIPATRLHRSARAGEAAVHLDGPTLGQGRSLGVDGIDLNLLARLGRAGVSFPTGYDTWIFSRQGTVTAIPGDVVVSVS